MTPTATNYSVREQRGWYMYDFANSAFSTTVVTLFLGPYLTALAKAAADSSGYVHPFGIPIDARSYWSYMVALSVIFQVLFLPMVGAVADYGRRKKQVLAATAYLGAAATMAMFFLEGSDYLFGGLLFLIANVSFGASEVIYNSFLPEIAPPEDRDAVSSKGFAIGYLGGGLLLASESGAASEGRKHRHQRGMAVRISLCSAGVWWAIFTIPTLLALRNRGPGARAGGGSERGAARCCASSRTPRRSAKVSADVDVSDRLSALQRRDPDRAHARVAVRQRRTEDLRSRN